MFKRNDMKKIILASALLVSAAAAAQQQPLYSQYLQNAFVLNPAVAGVSGITEIRSVIRNQWTGLEENMNGSNPKTNTVSLSTGWPEKKMGLGAYIFTDKLGPVSRSGVSGTYAYRFKVGNESMLSFGLAGMFYQYRLNTSELKFDAAGNSDKVLMNGDFKAYSPNVSFGVYYKAPTYFVGFSIPEMLQQKITSSADFFVVEEKRHVYFNGGAVLKLSDNMDIDPSLLVKYVPGAPAQADINVILDYKRSLNFGISYRSSAALSLMFGYVYKEAFKFGYAYDLTTSGLSTYAGGTHEITIGYNIHRKKKEDPKEIKPEAPPPPQPEK
jgi:type IX secretion system PorP/SprF family membrane protein